MNKTILIIEDNKALRMVMRDELVSNDFKVVTAENGKEGLELIEETEPDLIVLDLIMPEMSGEEVLKNLQEKGISKRIPVVVTSSKSEQAEINNCLNVLGARDYFIKSEVSIDLIVKKIKSLLI